ncbi:MAG: leucine-rich repeat protein, partial [Oscillospiraceae bacterium]|nr:leucine-rich repeat protein [Oscillospiraceae bacterium]
MRRAFKWWISAVVCMVLLLMLIPGAAFAAGTTTLYCDAPDDWDNCNIYWWGSAETNPTWPGEAMTKNADGLWAFEVPSDATNIIFNNGSVQTGDLPMPTDDKVMFSYEAYAWGTYGSEVEVIEKYFVAGSAGLCGSEWDPGDPANQMTETSEGVWTKSYPNVAAGTYEFKITVGNWSKDWGVSGTGAEGDPVVNNYVLELTGAAGVNITFTPADGVITTSTFTPVDPDESPEPVPIVASGKCGDNATWTRDADGLLIISGTGIVRSGAFGGQDQVRSVIVEPGITGISSDTFRECPKLTDVTLPESLVSIGSYAFYDCNSLASVEIPESVTYIGSRAFAYCEDLDSVVLPGGASITSSAFFGDKVSLVLSEGTTSIKAEQFRDWDCIISVTLPKGLISIGDYAFAYCNELTTVTVAEAGEDEAHPLGNGSVGKYAFAYCDKLTSVTIPAGISKLGWRMFYDCDCFSELTLTSATPYLIKSVFAGGNDSIDLILAGDVTEIKDGAFRNCPMIASVTLPEGLTSIGANAFRNCYRLKT